jgi:DNA polymerase
VPSDGNDFVAADLATVEARVVAWVADETALLDQFREPDTDVYIWFVQQIFVGVRIVKDGENDHLRQLGKETILGLGFGMGYETFLKKVREAMPEVDADIVRTLFDAYQASFPRIRAIRYALMSAFSRAVSESAVSTIGKCTFEPSSAPEALSPSVVVRLPTGRALYYRSVIIEREPTAIGSRPVFWYAPHANLTRTPARARAKGERLFADGQRRVRLTPQVLVENVVQAIARDVMVHQVLEIARLGLRPAFHAHDEEVFECDACDCVDAAAHRADCPWTTAGALVERVMSDVPSTLPALAGLPLKAELKRSVKERYG